MLRSNPDALPMTRLVLRALIALNLILGVLITILFVASVVAEGPVMEALGVPPTARRAIIGMWLIMLLGVAAVPLAHVVLSRLLEIVRTVTRGDPFVTTNAARLRVIAWSVVGLELLHLAIAGAAAAASSDQTRIQVDWADLSVTRWLAVLLLFVLAQVFEQGAHMREELEGTV